jgi:hypothetical protein
MGATMTTSLDEISTAREMLEYHGFKPADGVSLAAAIDTALSALIHERHEFEATPTQRDLSTGLYVGWDELRRRVAPQIGRDRFRAMIKLKIHRTGFPRFRDEWSGFYWPAVQRWLDLDNGVGSEHGLLLAEDGPENFDRAPRKRSKSPSARSS